MLAAIFYWEKYTNQLQDTSFSLHQITSNVTVDVLCISVTYLASLYTLADSRITPKVNYFSKHEWLLGSTRIKPGFKLNPFSNRDLCSL